jgi:hypothetical protein
VNPLFQNISEDLVNSWKQCSKATDPSSMDLSRAITCLEVRNYITASN